jgi:predicted esterase
LFNISEKHLIVERTARYCTLGGLNQNTKRVWIVLHGHKQLASSFIMNFAELADEGDYVIAPEGLNKLYIRNDSGDVGASWMTKEDRENEINDYVNYLDKLFEFEVENKSKNFSFRVYALGFSQGAATLTRWLALGKSKVDIIIPWCGGIGHDVDYSVSENFKSAHVHLVYSTKDKYYNKDFGKTQEEILVKYGIKSELHMFEGGHEVSAKLIKQLRITNDK